MGSGGLYGALALFVGVELASRLSRPETTMDGPVIARILFFTSITITALVSALTAVRAKQRASRRTLGHA